MSNDLPATLDEREPASARPKPVLHIVWQHGRATPSAAVLDRDAVLIGRSPGCHIALDSALASRRHAEIRREGPVLTIRDLASRNGTYVNGRRVEAEAIGPDDVVRIGDCVAVVASAPLGISSWTLDDLGAGLMAGPVLASHLAFARRVAPSDVSVALSGATGTGKERLARALHVWSGRSGPFCAVNCAAIPVNLAEAELFGYRKGAFTGAAYPRQGYFREAEGGTLLLDEIADLGIDVQAKLLRAVEEKRIRPLGDTKSYPIDVRLVSATQVRIDELVKRSLFREDLAARLATISFELPRLERRKTDIMLLFRHFLRQHLAQPPEIGASFAETLLLYDWPRNVRELDSLVRRLALLHGAEGVEHAWQPGLLPERMRFDSHECHAAAQTAAPPAPRSLSGLRASATKARRQAELDRFVAALEATAGNVKAAAARTGISRQQAYRLMQGRMTESEDLEPLEGCVASSLGAGD